MTGTDPIHHQPHIDLASTPARSLLLARGLEPQQVSYRREILRRRLRALAMVVGLLMLAWIPIDRFGLDAESFLRVFALRLGSALVLFAIAALLWRRVRWLPLKLALPLVLLAQCVPFCGIGASFGPDTPALLGLGYGMLPFVVVAQLALFPLALLEVVLLALPVVVVMISGGIWSANLPGHELLADLWLILLLASVAAWAGAAQLSLLLGLLNARRAAAHDALTGLANRRAARERLAAEFARCARRGVPLTVLALDLDHFKRVNDHHGHACGDRVLVQLAGTMDEALRAGDLPARMGGEEFLAILPDTAESEARGVAERVRAAVEAMRVPDPRGVVAITISIGLAQHRAGESIDELLARADQALYRAKSNGRNRVEVAGLPAAGSRQGQD